MRSTLELGYNTEMEKLAIPEYGRNVHKMVEHAIKIQDKVENSMTTIGVFGIIFLLFFMAIIYFTMQAIRIYKGDGGDDDGDGEQDFDDK